MMPTHRKNRKRTVVPFATNVPSPVGPDPSINVQSVAAEVVVHCEPSKESTVLEKKHKILTRMNPHHVAFVNNKNNQSPPHNSMSLWKSTDCRHVKKF